jgi:hypothetical protein
MAGRSGAAILPSSAFLLRLLQHRCHARMAPATAAIADITTRAMRAPRGMSIPWFPLPFVSGAVVTAGEVLLVLPGNNEVCGVVEPDVVGVEDFRELLVPELVVEALIVEVRGWASNGHQTLSCLHASTTQHPA